LQGLVECGLDATQSNNRVQSSRLTESSTTRYKTLKAEGESLSMSPELQLRWLGGVLKVLMMGLKGERSGRR
jgi:hypothetical protein